MRKHLLVLVLLGLPATASKSQDEDVQVTPLQEPVVFLIKECKGLGVEPREGRLSVFNLQKFMAICVPGKSTQVKCVYQDEKEHVIGGIEAAKGIIAGHELFIEKDTEILIANLTTRIAYTESEITAENGMRGKKVCSGKIVFKPELENALKNQI